MAPGNVILEETRVHSVKTPQCWEHFIIQNIIISLCVHATTDKHQWSYAEGLRAVALTLFMPFPMAKPCRAGGSTPHRAVLTAALSHRDCGRVSISRRQAAPRLPRRGGRYQAGSARRDSRPGTRRPALPSPCGAGLFTDLGGSYELDGPPPPSSRSRSERAIRATLIPTSSVSSLLSARRAGEGNGRSLKKPADQWHRPTRFLHADIRVTQRGIEPGSPWWEASSLTLSHRGNPVRAAGTREKKGSGTSYPTFILWIWRDVAYVPPHPLESRRATSCGYNSSHPVWHALYECLQDIHGDSSPFLLQPFHELSNGFWPCLTSPHPAIQFVSKMFYRVEVGALGGPVQSANIAVGVSPHPNKTMTTLLPTADPPSASSAQGIILLCCRNDGSQQNLDKNAIAWVCANPLRSFPVDANRHKRITLRLCFTSLKFTTRETSAGLEAIFITVTGIDDMLNLLFPEAIGTHLDVSVSISKAEIFANDFIMAITCFPPVPTECRQWRRESTATLVLHEGGWKHIHSARDVSRLAEMPVALCCLLVPWPWSGSRWLAASAWSRRHVGCVLLSQCIPIWWVGSSQYASSSFHHMPVKQVLTSPEVPQVEGEGITPHSTPAGGEGVTSVPRSRGSGGSSITRERGWVGHKLPGRGGGWVSITRERGWVGHKSPGRGEGVVNQHGRGRGAEEEVGAILNKSH
ncbi:hypothetical protein PR048_002370 [Dryococelus australis]|uniref:Uncharacterized protein n=1 Tax=Dryococelus australis TaxID=614101 RepID=A0ABQ9ILF0_9NEOP|nr:hypothetical protein PR048_002370 [Dryococelus australis]